MISSWAILPTAASWDISTPSTFPWSSGMAWMMPPLRIRPLHSRWALTPATSPMRSPRVMIFPPLVMARAMISARVSSAFRKNPSAHVHLGAGRPDEDAVEACDGALAHEVRRGVHLQALYGLHADVVVQEKPALLDDAHGAGPHHHLFRPVVDHREAQLGVLLDEELRDAHVKTPLEMRRRGAAGDDVELRALLGDDQVVDVLADVLLVQVQTGLHGPDGLAPGRARMT